MLGGRGGFVAAERAEGGVVGIDMEVGRVKGEKER